MKKEPFLKPRLVGSRFKDGTIPLEYLNDIAAIGQLIIEVAKLEYKKGNPSRQRSPRGFCDKIDLRLTGIEAGSAIPVISLIHMAPTLFPSDNQIYYEHARDSITKAINAAEQNLSITEYMPEELLGFFDKIGRSLRENESIEFTTDQNVRVKLTREIRRKLILAQSSTTEYTEVISIHGSIPEVNQDKNTFQIKLLNKQIISSSIIEKKHSKSIMELFNGYRSGTFALITGTGRFNSNNKLLKFDSIEQINILDPLDFNLRIEQLRLLRDGWLDGEGVAPSSEGLNWISNAFTENYPDNLPLPYVYPTESGGIQLEWTIKSIELSLNINLESHKAEWHYLNIEQSHEDSSSFDLDSDDDWNHLNTTLIKIIGGIV